MWIAQAAHPFHAVSEMPDSKDGKQRGFTRLNKTGFLWLDFVCDLEELHGGPLDF